MDLVEQVGSVRPGLTTRLSFRAEARSAAGEESQASR
jgi:hypothetical protein